MCHTARGVMRARSTRGFGWGRATRDPRLRIRSRWLAGLVVLLAALPLGSGALGAPGPRARATTAALRALGSHRHRTAEIVFALPRPLPAGTVIGEGGPAAPGATRHGRPAVSRTRVLATLKRPAWLFYEDLAPFTEYAHPGRVALVDARTGHVTLTPRIDWPPLVDGHLPSFLASQRAYLRATDRVFYRPYTVSPKAAFARALAHRAPTPARAVTAALDPTRGRLVAGLIAADHACTVRFSDAVKGGWYRFARTAQSRAALDWRFTQLARLGARLHSAIYPRSSDRSPAAFVAHQIRAHGCRDVVLYLAGAGYGSRRAALNVGIRAGARRLRHVDVTESQLRALIAAHRRVHFELVLDAAHAGAFRALLSLANVLLVATPIAPDGGAFTYLPAVRIGHRMWRNDTNPLHLLQLTDRLVFGIDEVIADPAEVAQMRSLRAAGRLPSAMAYLLARALARGGDVDFVGGSGAGGTPDVQVQGFSAAGPQPSGGGATPGGGSPAPSPGGVVLPPPPGPTVSAGADAYATGNLSPLTIDASHGVLANDSDSAGGALTVDRLNGAGGTPPLHGTSAQGATVTVAADGSFTYDPGTSHALSGLAPGDKATDTFTYRADDGHGGVATAIVTITVTGIDRAPVLSGIESSALQYRAGDPAAAVTGSLTVADAVQQTLSGATVAITAGLDKADDVLGFANQNGITGSYDAASGILTLTGSASVSDYQAALRSVTFQTADSSGNPNPRTITFEATGANGHTSSAVTRTVDVAQVAQPPKTNTSTFNAVGNTTLAVGTSPTGPAVTVAGGTVLANVQGSGPLTVTANTKPAHGSVTMNADGTFTYLPDAGYTGADSFTYTVTDDGDPSNPQIATGTVDITVSSLVWYVDDTAATAGDGRSDAPFESLASAAARTGSNDFLFLYGGGASYDGPVQLRSGEQLIGQSDGLVVNGHTLVPAAGSNPTITDASGDGIDLAQDAVVSGVDVSGTGGAGISAAGVDGATIASDVTISGADGPSLDVSGGSGTIDVAATIADGTGAAVSISGRAGGTVNISGPVTHTGGGIALSDNPGATISFDGKLTLDTGAATAFSATGGGTVTATGARSSLKTSTGTALSVAGTTIGAGGLTFASISAGTATTGPASAISLSGTGTLGGLSVTGAGLPGSGGTIQSTTASAIIASAVSALTLDYMDVEGAGAPGSQADDVSVTGSGDLTLDAEFDTFSSATLDGVSVAGTGTGSDTVTLDGDTFTGNARAGIELQDTGHATAMTFAIAEDVLNGQGGNAINLANFGSGTWQGKIDSNAVGGLGASGTGSSGGSGINISQEGTGTITAYVGTNNVQGVAKGWGINGQAGDGSGTLNLTLAFNTIDTGSASSLDAISVDSGTTPVDATTVCLSTKDNAAATEGTAAGNGLYDASGLSVIQQEPGASFEIQGLPAGADAAAVESYLAAHNTLAGPGGGAYAQPSSGFTTSQSSCPLPPGVSAP